MSNFWSVSDAPATCWSSQRALNDPSAAAIAELVSVITGCDLIKAQAVVEDITQQSSLFDSSKAWHRFRYSSGLQLQAAGLTEKQATKLSAALEFGKRVYAASVDVAPIIDDPQLAAELLRYELGYCDVEKFAVIVLDVKHKVLAVQVISIGTKTECHAHPAEVFGAVIRAGGSRCIVAHNHPSGSTDPSDNDLELTKMLLQGASCMGIPVLDHLILAGDRHRSLRQDTSLWLGEDD